MGKVRRTVIQKAISELDDLRNMTRMSPEKLAKLSQKWRDLWVSMPLTKVIDLLQAEIDRSVEKKK